MNSIDELFSKIQKVRKRIGISKHPAWYRGHSKSQYKLVPSLFRYKLGLKHERNLMSVFQTQSANLIPLSLSSSWEILAVMQHHGTPTRLLDWTESIDVAIFFAVWGNCRDPVIWILNPFRLNQISVNENVIFDRLDKASYDYYSTIKDKGTLPHQLPIAILSPWINQRITRQKGCFTVHGSDTNPIEMFQGRFVQHVKIPQHLVKDLRKYLKNKGMNDFELFPDLDGLSRGLKRRFHLY